MNLLVISRDKEFIARLCRIYNDGVTTLMVIPSVGWIVHKERVPKDPHMALLDISGIEPGVWPRYVANLRRMLALKVIVVDRRAFWRRAEIAFENYAVRYMTKAKSRRDWQIREAVTYTLRSKLPLLPGDCK